MSSNYLDAVRSVFSGSSQRQAAQAHGISRDTVSVLVKYAHSRGWQQTEDLASLSEADFETFPPFITKWNLADCDRK